MPEAGSNLPATVQRQAFERIAAWRQAPASVIECPRCKAPGLVVHDRSARPYAEWYQLVCGACGLDHTFQVPVSRAGMEG